MGKSVAALAEAQSVNAATEADHLDAAITEAINAQILTKVMDMNNIDDITTGPNAVANAGAIPALKEATSTQGFHYATSGETCVAVPQNECAAAGNAMRDWNEASIGTVMMAMAPFQLPYRLLIVCLRPPTTNLVMTTRKMAMPAMAPLQLPYHLIIVYHLLLLLAKTLLL